MAYYLHWPMEDLMRLDHAERRRWCEQVSTINRKLSGTDKNTFQFK